MIHLGSSEYLHLCSESRLIVSSVRHLLVTEKNVPPAGSPSNFESPAKNALRDGAENDIPLSGFPPIP